MAQYAARLRRLICEGVKAEDYDHPWPTSALRWTRATARRLLRPGRAGAWADVSGSQFLEPDGRFPNHIPNPENPEAMASVCAATLKAGRGSGRHF